MIIFRAGGAYDEHNIAASVHTYAHFYNLTPPWGAIFIIFLQGTREQSALLVIFTELHNELD